MKTDFMKTELFITGLLFMVLISPVFFIIQIVHASSSDQAKVDKVSACQKTGVYKEKNYICFNDIINKKTTSAVLSLLDKNKA